MRAQKTQTTDLQKFPLIVGAGRVARHWKHYLELKNIPYLEWFRASDLTFADFVKKYEGQITLVYLLVSDAAIEEFFLENHGVLPRDIPWFHASGALQVEGVLDAHPLMTFSLELYSLEQYESISVVISGELEPIESQLLAGLPNPIVQIDPQDKPLYHALCVLGGAGTGSLWAYLENQWTTLGLPARSWKVYQRQVFKNLILHGKSAITGPWVRGDQITTQRNEDSFHGSSGKSLYQVLKGIYDHHGKH